jgi:hypothetical protein
MSFNPMILVLVGALMVIVAFARRPWKVRVQNAEGNTMVGNVGESVNQTYQVNQRVARDPAPAMGTAQVITWIIAIAGVVVAGIGIYFNAIKP